MPEARSKGRVLVMQHGLWLCPIFQRLLVRLSCCDYCITNILFRKTSFEQVGVRTSAVKDQFISVDRVDQYPIWFNMTITRADILSPQWMVIIGFRQRPFVEQQINDLAQFAHIVSALLCPFVVFFEKGCIARRQHYASNCTNKSLMSLAVCRLRPASASLIACSVSSFGIWGRKGSPLSALPWLTRSAA